MSEPILLATRCAPSSDDPEPGCLPPLCCSASRYGSGCSPCSLRGSPAPRSRKDLAEPVPRRLSRNRSPRAGRGPPSRRSPNRAAGGPSAVRTAWCRSRPCLRSSSAAPTCPSSPAAGRNDTPFGGGAVAASFEPRRRSSLVRDPARRVAAEHHPHRAAEATLAAARHRGEASTSSRRPFHNVPSGRSIFAPSRERRRASRRRRPRKRNARLERICPSLLRGVSPRMMRTRFLLVGVELYAQEGQTPSEGGHSGNACIAVVPRGCLDNILDIGVMIEEKRCFFDKKWFQVNGGGMEGMWGG